LGGKRYGVTIIIPVYNTEKYLKECIDSVLNQTYKNYEVIIVNDGSTDSSRNIITNYTALYSNIVLLEQINKGQGAARNQAIKKAKGKYIYFLDSDDYILPNTIERLYNNCEDNKLDLIIFDGATFYDSEIAENIKKKPRYHRNGVYNGIYSGEKLLELLMRKNDFFVSPCLYMLSKETLINNNIFFPEGIIHEDELFTFQLFKCSERVAHFDKILFMRRIRDNSTMTGRNFKRSFKGYVNVFNEIYEQYCDEITTLKDYAVNKKLGHIYMNIIKNYTLMDFKDRKKNRKIIKEIKKIGTQNNYFGRKHGYVITRAYKIYKLLSNLKKKINKA